MFKFRLMFSENSEQNNYDSDEHYHFTRQNGKVVGRILIVSPKESERYYLQTLSSHVSGSTPFKDWRVLERNNNATYWDPCLQRGLLANNFRWNRALMDTFNSSFLPLTELYIIPRAHCKHSNTNKVFDSSKDKFIVDIRNRFRLKPQTSNTQLALDYVSIKIKTALTTILY